MGVNSAKAVPGPKSPTWGHSISSNYNDRTTNYILICDFTPLIIFYCFPFLYSEYRKRDIHSWLVTVINTLCVPAGNNLTYPPFRSKDNGVVKYYEHMRFEFDESRSVAPLSQLVTVINAPLLVSSHLAAQ